MGPGRAARITVAVVTDFRELLRLAYALRTAEATGDAERIEQARAEHEAYRQLCLTADAMTLGVRKGELLR